MRNLSDITPKNTVRTKHDVKFNPNTKSRTGSLPQDAQIGASAASNKRESLFVLQPSQQRNSDPSDPGLNAHAVIPPTAPAQATAAPKRIIETASAELEDGTQIEIIEDPQDPSRSQLAVFKNSEVRLVDRFEFENRIFVPIPRDTNLLRHVRLPRGVKACGTALSLLIDIGVLLSCGLDISHENLFLLASFVLSTWFIERLPVAPYLALVGLPRAGKSTALTALSFLCRRALLTADITSAAFYRACDRLTPTLLIDETGTAGERRALFHLLRTGPPARWSRCGKTSHSGRSDRR